MEVELNNRNFEVIAFTDHNGQECSLQQSSAISGEEGMANPGSSFVWLGCDKNSPPHLGHEMSPRMHLERVQVAELVEKLSNWLATGSFTTNVKP